MRKLVALVAVAALVAFAAPAFAANPFMDVPMNHWAYDAVSQLAARGIVTGYPDGAFKGQWKATRYEMACVVARALAYVDMNKASKEDLELLKKLVVEFKDELDALGVKVEDLDKRVGALEEGVGGWKLWGELRFDAKWADEGDAYDLTGDTDFTMSRYRIWMSKKVDDKVTFYARLGEEDVTFERYYVSVALPWDATAWIGKWVYDWEDEDGFYIDNDAWFTDQDGKGFYFSKPFSMGQFDAFVMHSEASTTEYGDVEASGDIVWTGEKTDGEAYYYGARLKVAFNDQFGMGAVYLKKDYDEAVNTATGTDEIGGDPLTTNKDWDVYWAQAYVNYTPDVTLRGRYIWQEIDGFDDTNAYQAILQVGQDTLGFTSLWIEYADLEKDFAIDTADPYANYGADILGTAMTEDTEVWFVRADQKWNDTWGTFQRYVTVDKASDVDNFTFGVNYWYTPNIKFELVYDDVDYDNDTQDDSLLRLRTHVFF